MVQYKKIILEVIQKEIEMKIQECFLSLKNQKKTILLDISQETVKVL